MNITLRKLHFSFLIIILAGISVFAQAELEEGQSLFQSNCAACHNKNMKDDMTGPALAGMEDRWSEYPREDLYGWIRNSQELVSKKHPRAVEVYNDWNKVVMTPFPNLTDEQIENIITYINAVDAGTWPPKLESAEDIVQAPTGLNSKWIYGILLVILAVMAWVLAKIISRLRYIANVDKIDAPYQDWTLKDVLTNKSFISFIIFALIIGGFYTMVNNAVDFGRSQGYAPVQPINFSHATHSGLQGIDCQFCHDGARRSKHSTIPAANTCMKCHKAIKKGSKYGTGELTKIYASLGFNPLTDKYIPNYENMPSDSIELMFKQWIEQEYLKAKSMAVLDGPGKLEVENQWKGIVKSLTNETKKDIPGGIEWVRIHSLPDHVYFNHAQHVNVGELECQTCHGKVEEMDVLRQYAPLSMGWCINCHRQTDVASFASNDYYKESYKEFHTAIANGQMNNVTVEDIGGLECQKCHY